MNGQMDQFMKEMLKLAYEMDMEHLFLQVEKQFTLENGKMDYDMVKEKFNLNLGNNSNKIDV